ncbi:hypothetical protein RI367_001580 [Sorochytrium milnesiophthora]
MARIGSVKSTRRVSTTQYFVEFAHQRSADAAVSGCIKIQGAECPAVHAADPDATVDDRCVKITGLTVDHTAPIIRAAMSQCGEVESVRIVTLGRAWAKVQFKSIAGAQEVLRVGMHEIQGMNVLAWRMQADVQAELKKVAACKARMCKLPRDIRKDCDLVGLESIGALRNDPAQAPAEAVLAEKQEQLSVAVNAVRGFVPAAVASSPEPRA